MFSSLENHYWRGQEMTTFSPLWSWIIDHTQCHVKPGKLIYFRKISPSPWGCCVLFPVNQIPGFSYRASMVPTGRKQKTSILWRQATPSAACSFYWKPCRISSVGHRVYLSCESNPKIRPMTFFLLRKSCLPTVWKQWILDLEGTPAI